METLSERVLRAVELVPPGRVVSYGDVAELVGTAARQVGRVLSQDGAAVAWWRVTNRDGEFPPSLLQRALPHWAAEGIEVKANGRGCDINRFRADLAGLGASYDARPR